MDPPDRPIHDGGTSGIFRRDSGFTIHDQTLRYVEAFLDRRGLNVRSVTAWLERWGCYCDCEVLMNLDCRWKDPS